MKGQKLETVANAVIVVTGIIAIPVFARTLWPRADAQTALRTEAYVKGDTLPKPFPVDFSKSDRTLLLVLDSRCTYCTDSVPFYRTLVEQRAIHPARARLVAVGFESAATLTSYLNEHAVRVDDVAHVTPDILRGTGTPSLLLVDRHGRVEAFWVGLLQADKQAEVLRSIDASWTRAE